MKKVFDKGNKKTISEKNNKKEKLINPLMRKYHQPVIVHAVNNLNSFYKILNQSKIKLPKNHHAQKKCPYMEKLLGIDNSIFLSLGFIYSVNYGFKYNLIFDLNLLQEATYYEKPLAFKCWKSIADYWFENDIDYLKKISNKNKECNEVVNKYTCERKKKTKFVGFEFWRIEKELFDFFQKYPKNSKLLKISKDMEKSIKIKFPKSKRIAKKDYLTHKCPEVLYKKDIDLLKSPYFLGFFIDGRISPRIEKIIKNKYKRKIIFDGKKIEVIK